MAWAEGAENGGGRLWIKLFKGHKVARDKLIACGRDDPREALRSALGEMDLSQPLWLDRHESDWSKYGMARFKPEHFMEAVDFDFMEISYIYGEDEVKRARRREPYEDA